MKATKLNSNDGDGCLVVCDGSSFMREAAGLLGAHAPAPAPRPITYKLKDQPAENKSRTIFPLSLSLSLSLLWLLAEPKLKSFPSKKKKSGLTFRNKTNDLSC